MRMVNPLVADPHATTMPMQASREPANNLSARNWKAARVLNAVHHASVTARDVSYLE
jgi:hypothetical protein